MQRVCDPAMVGPRDTECICEAYDDGDAENGPSLSVSVDEDCPVHGRGTAWAIENEMKWSYADYGSGVASGVLPGQPYSARRRRLEREAALRLQEKGA